MNNDGRLFQLIFLFSLAAALAFIISCTDSSSPVAGRGELKLTMVDAPSGYDKVNIVVTRVEVHKVSADSNSGWFVINNNTSTYDLLELRNGTSVVIGNTELEAGQYSQIRLLIGNGSNVVVNGVVHPLEIPSGEQTGIKLNHSFEILSGSLYELLLDFDAKRSIVLTGNGRYILKPVIRLVPVLISGSISGSINPLSAAGYVYAISGTDTASTIANVITGSFKIMALLQQSYRIEILSASSAYNNATINNVIVVPKQNTDLGTVTLSVK